MSNSNKTNNTDSDGINIKWVLPGLVFIVFVVFGFYFLNFNSHILKNEIWRNVFQNLSENTGNWGTFGDYFGGILNPGIAASALYLIVKTYKLQKRELKLSTDALNAQVNLAALTALLNSNLTRIGLLKSEKAELLNEIPPDRRPQATDTRPNEDLTDREAIGEEVFSGKYSPTIKKIREINREINSKH